MRSIVIRRFMPAALALLLAAAMPTIASAQSQEEVERTARALDDAAAARADAAAALAAFDRQLADALASYEAITAELVELTYAIADREDALHIQERELADLRAAAYSAVAAAYAEAADAAWAVSFDAPNFEAAAVADVVMARSAERRASAVTRFTTARSTIRGDHDALDHARTRITELRRDADAMVVGFIAMVEDAAVVKSDAVAAEAEATVLHEQAVDEWEAAVNSISPAAFAWKPLIEKHFREELWWEALQVLDCESRGNPNALHPASGASGLFQFLAGTWVLASTLSGNPGASPFDPEANVAAAAWLLEHSERVDHWRGRWGHWVCQPIGWETPPLISSN